jgi:translation initiation factor 2 beta subunit (eIF-2beta)/eIF-5
MSEDFHINTAKKCKACGEPKEQNQFSPDKRTWDRLTPECKACRAKKSAQYYVANKDKIGQNISEIRKRNYKINKALVDGYTCQRCNNPEAKYKNIVLTSPSMKIVPLFYSPEKLSKVSYLIWCRECFQHVKSLIAPLAK